MNFLPIFVTRAQVCVLYDGHAAHCGLAVELVDASFAVREGGSGLVSGSEINLQQEMVLLFHRYGGSAAASRAELALLHDVQFVLLVILD